MRSFIRRGIWALAPVLIFLAFWEVLSRAGALNNALFPCPSVIIRQIFELIKRGWPKQSVLLIHCITTLRRVGISFITGLLAGIVIGCLMGINNHFHAILNPLITLLLSVPGISLAPLFIVWLGFGDITIIPLGALSAFFPIALAVVTGIRSIDPQLVRAAKTMGARRWRILTQVYLPWSAVFTLNALKISLARCWMTVIAVEFIAAANWGLGYMIWNAAEYLRSEVVFGGVVVLVLLYYLIDRAILELLERKTVIRWGMMQEKP